MSDEKEIHVREPIKLPPISNELLQQAQSSLAAPNGWAKITQRQLESILINEGIIQAAAIKDPDGYDGGKTKLAMRIATQQINELLSLNEKGQQ